MALPPSGRRPASGPLQIPGFEELTAKLEALRELIEVGAGQRRDARYKGVTHLDRWVTVRELIELGILSEPDRINPNIVNPGMTIGLEPTGPIPDAITGLRADIDGFSVILSWEQPAAIVSYVEIWRADVDNVSVAVRIGQSVIDQSTGSKYVDKVGAVGSLYYWARNVSKGNQVGPMTGPVMASTDPVEDPSDLQITSGTAELLIASDGTIITRAKLTWTDSIDPSAIKYTLQYKRSADSVWLNLPQAEKGIQIAWAYPLKDNTEYDFRVRAERINGDVSDWVTVTNYLVLGKQQPPSDVTGLGFDGVYLTWNPISDLDRLGYIVRYRTDGLTDWDTATPAHGQEYLTDTRLDTRDLVGGAIKFLIKAIDTSGNESVNAAVLDVELRPSDVGTLAFDGVYLSWPEITDLDRKGYIVRYRTDSGTDWTTAIPAHGSGFLTEARFDTRLLVGGAVKFLVKAIDAGGNQSINAAMRDADLRPPTPSSFLITRQPDGTREFTWSHPSPPDDLAGAKIRFYLGTTSDWSVMTPLHDGLLVASPYESNLLAAGTYTFAIKYVDQAGNESESATFITTTLGDPRLAGAIEDINEAPRWDAELDALSFFGGDGDDYVNATNIINSVLTAWTMECWVNIDPTDTYATFAAFSGTNSGFGIGDGTFVANVVHNSTVIGSVSAPGVNLLDGRAHHVAFAYDSADDIAKLYVDGREVASATIAATITQTTTGFRVGTGTGYHWGPTTGKIALVRVYNRRCTGAEIAEHARFSPDTNGLILDWRFDEGSGTVAYDRSGNGYNGTFVSSPTWTTDSSISKSACHVDDATGWLVADGTATWATLPSMWGGWNQWNASPVSPTTYLREIDVGVVATFTPLVSVTYDGTATVEESHSDDGINWSTYAALGPVITARYIRVRVTVSGSYPKLKMMRTILSGSPITEVIEDLNTANLTGSYRIGVGDVRLPIVKSYAKIKKVGLTLQSVGAGWSWELIDKDTTVGPRVKIYNASNALADAVIDADISGL